MYAYHNGYQDYINWVPLADNPYKKNTPDYHAWLLGWADAEGNHEVRA